MTFFVLAVIIVLALLLAVSIAKQRRAPLGSYRQKKPLSDAEQTLYWRLVEAMPECVILSQVTFSRFMEPERARGGARQALFNRISSRSIDFLVCLKDFTVVAAVELDDGTHSAEQDDRRDALLKGAGIEVVRMHVRDIPSVERIRAIFTR